MNTARDTSASGTPSGSEFLLRRVPDARRPAHPYALLWTSNDALGQESTREVGCGDYSWALRTARILSIPRASIEHDQRGGVDDGYEGWHLNARILGTDQR
ncbi:hypothetical protein HQ325_19670 [Rhodococcus sp. BP-349]|uniref:hypothetical protein n=1 Tax=unclassified Rhodococcus (in: high G+C Gram-positive bacteria) TaxID=192944 RepID=UPI001C9A4A5B|nr:MULTISPECIES: hypothetical protein [unclassified Rhodococcus (in: high G+C Gram-positive bacteria)]MBY6540891.1 hypothetical protein [Rhodococcus sp. BP-363]MBY6545083.1 hypothetical protein [Rhodococcus sp. BP-369]MBY6564313.1 hypothetical protein [Rhodococcus sp. BP-370]MBY6578750.1 hypothetical protein [Rhodococcus sp. BP-364]MBY6588051.1 hypothetical protein [Rhodococcus sp. BP-358]